PSPETDSIHQQLLEAPSVSEASPKARARHPDLHPSPDRRPEMASPSRPRSRKHVGAAAVAAAITLAAAVGVVVHVTSNGNERVRVRANSVVALNPSGSIAASGPV